MTVLAFALITTVLIFLMYLFLASDFGYFYVWSNSSSDLGFIYKISAVWAGGAGSMLTLVWFMLLVTVVELRIGQMRIRPGKRFNDLFQLTMMAVVLVFLLVLLSMGPFAETVTTPDTAWRLALYPNGMGLVLSFQTPEMILHPILIFAGYSFCLCVFSASLAHFVTKEQDWVPVSRRWSRLAWLFMTLGIGIGALWAYYEIGWGGYWSWDPVETSSLLIWLLITAFLHTQARHAMWKEYQILCPALGMLSFISVLFTTFVARAGGLWIGSVHTFNISTGQAAGERLIEVLQNSPQVSGLLFLMVVLLILTFAFSLSKHKSLAEDKKRKENGKENFPVNDRNNMLLGVGLLIVTVLVMLFILIKNVDATQASNYEEFNQKMSVFAVAIVVAMSVCLIWRNVGQRIAMKVAILLVLLSVALAAIGAMIQLSPLAAFALPSFLVTACIAVFRIVRSGSKGSLGRTLRNVAPQLIHLGIALTLIGYVFSSTLQVSPTAGGDMPLRVGESVDLGDYTVRLIDLEMRSLPPPASQIYNAKGSAIFDVSKSGDLVESNITVSNLYYSSGTELSKASAGVHVHKTFFEDLYLDFDWLNNSTALIHVKVIPLINVLWAGLSALCIGMTLQVALGRQDSMSAQT
jgi:cytochrome c-type biogenesis protein CcmF